MFRVLNIHGFVPLEGAAANACKLFEECSEMTAIDEESDASIAVFGWRKACVPLNRDDLEVATNLIVKVLDVAKAQGVREETLACVLLDSARIFLMKGDLARAEELYRESLDVWIKVPKNRTRHATIARARHVMGLIEYKRGSLESAVKWVNQSLEIYRRHYNGDLTNPLIVKAESDLKLLQDEFNSRSRSNAPRSRRKRIRN